jgi:hypothetical protein
MLSLNYSAGVHHLSSFLPIQKKSFSSYFKKEKRESPFKIAQKKYFWKVNVYFNNFLVTLGFEKFK